MPNTTMSVTFASDGTRFVSDQTGPLSQATAQQLFRHESRSTVNTPGFGRIKKVTRNSKLLPMNPFGYQKIRIDRYSGSVRFTNPTNGNFTLYQGCLYGLYGGPGPVPWEPTGPEIGAYQQRAIAKVLDKIKGQKASLAQVYAERKMTADLIASTATRIGKAVTLLFAKDIRGAAGTLGIGITRRKVRAFNREFLRNKRQAVANGWLELQYGWKPLLNDVRGSAEWLASKQSREIRSKAFSRIPVTNEDIQGFSQPEWQTLTSYKGKFDYSLTVWFQTTGVELASLAEAGFSNPVALGWELLPYSFVVDWFLPVGNYLGSLDATIGMSFEKGCYTQFLDSVVTQRSIAVNRRISSTQVSDAMFSMGHKKISVSRSVIGTFPSLEFPSFKNPFSFEHAANAIALMSQAFYPSSTSKRYR